MKRLIPLSLLVFLFSCGGTEESAENENSNADSTQVVEDIDYTDSLWIEEKDSNEVDVFIEDLPSSWIMLTDEEKDGENLIIYKWCEAETQNFSFEADKGENWKIYLAYGQDGEVCEIAFFEATEREEEGMQVVNGTLEFKAAYDESMRFVTFWYNKEKKLGHFEGMGMGSEWFVPKEFKDNYKTIEEDCEGLWE